MAAGGEAAKKRTGEIDLSQPDELARPRTKTGSIPKPVTTTPPPAKPAPSAPPAAADDMARTQRLPAFGAVPESREFGQYTLLDRIAVGGMAEVWKARMKGVEGFQKTVAIKRILPSLTDSPDFVTMFIDEAKLAAQLQHNNIIHIYDLGKLGEDFYIAMEYIEGQGSAHHPDTALAADGAAAGTGAAGGFAPRERARLRIASATSTIASSVSCIATSPQNVLISYEGDIKLCDFGIVKAVSKSSKTQMGALKGKLQYMSPEQAWGKPVDARSDIFSLGSLLFEMLTGRRLFAGDSEISVLESVRDCRVERPQAIDPAIPGEIDALVMKALEREPENRFPSAGAMQKEIERVLQSQRRSPSPADLAGYMHRLFSGEARAQEAGAGAAASGTAASWTGVGSLPSPPASSTGSQVKAIAAPAGATGVQKLEGEAKGRTMLWLAIAAAVLLGIGLYYFLGRTKTPAAPPTEAPPAAAASTGATSTGATGATEPPSATLPATGATGSTPVAPATAAPNLGQRVDQAVAQREAQLKSDFEAEKKRLADQIRRPRRTLRRRRQRLRGRHREGRARSSGGGEGRTDRLAAEKVEQDRLAAEKAEADRKAEEQRPQPPRRREARDSGCANRATRRPGAGWNARCGAAFPCFASATQLSSDCQADAGGRRRDRRGTGRRNRRHPRLAGRQERASARLGGALGRSLGKVPTRHQGWRAGQDAVSIELPLPAVSGAPIAVLPFRRRTLEDAWL